MLSLFATNRKDSGQEEVDDGPNHILKDTESVCLQIRIVKQSNSHFSLVCICAALAWLVQYMILQ